ncbi:hypothetical protein KY495_22600 [Massilia sp. PAMC28688]|uniref:hypothetical protein n=1 Tax=Massilia sp. PAMC28688 TaxID=2861283 RepID=UPI001C6286A8|nr:hypothetical protein [Massilia sp. PAMC28688]QYF93422.1 hypothetical protein KY495_22600 [Massilia sp. PAMC28688]
MKKYLLALCLATGSIAASAQNIDIQLGQTNYYGRIDLLNFGTPQLIYKEPMWVSRPANYRTIATLYLRVPPGHAKKWSKHCDRYDACGRPVYFVQDSWYNNTYVPRYQKVHGHGKNKHPDHDDDRNFRLSDRAGTSYDGARGQHDDGHQGKDHKDKDHKDKGHKGKDHKDKGGKGNGKH